MDSVKKSIQFSFMMTTIWILSISLPACAAEVMKGAIEQIKGNVEVMKRGTTEWIQAGDGMVIERGDRISSGVTGSAVLRYENSITEISAMTSFTVNSASKDDAAFKTNLFLQVGKLIAEVDHNSGKKNKFTVTTPSSVAGIRGSRMAVRENVQTGTEVTVEKGQGYAAPVKTSTASAAGASQSQSNKSAEKTKEGTGGNTSEEGTEQEPATSEPALGTTYSLSAGNSMSISAGVNNAENVKTAQTSLIDNAVASVVPQGSAPAEQAATTVSTEASDKPSSVAVKEDQSSQKQATETATAKTTIENTTPKTKFPDRPQD